VNLGIGVRGVEGDEVVWIDATMPEKAIDRHAVNRAAPIETCADEILPNRRACRALVIDEVGVARAARQGFDADAARAGIEIEHAIGFDAKRRER
jgi:hypothetical protein